MIYYNFNQQQKILFLDYQGIITTIDIAYNFEKILSDTNLPRILHIIQNEVNAEFIGTNMNINKALYYNEKLMQKFDLIKVAIIQIEPVSTAYSMLFKDLSQKQNYFIEIFSTQQTAIEWLKVRISDKE